MESYSSPPEPVYVMRASSSPIHSLLFYLSPSIECIYAGSQSGSINIWDLEKNRQITKLDSSTDPCLSLNFLKDDLINQRKGGTYDFWKISNSNWDLINSIKTDYYGFCRCQISPENALFIPLDNSQIGFFSLNSYKIEFKLNPYNLPNAEDLGTIMAIKPCIDDSNYILAAYDVGKLLLWDIRNKNVLSSMQVESSPMALDFYNTLMSGVIGGPSDKLMMFSLSAQHQLLQKKLFPLPNSGISVIKIRHDGKLLFVGTWNNGVRIYSYKSCKALAVLDQHKGTINDVIYSAKGVKAYNDKALIAVAGKDGKISFWDIYN